MALSYELSKALKDALWPQPYAPYQGEYIDEPWPDPKAMSRDEAMAKVYVACYSPSLAELVEAIPTRIDGKKSTLIIYRDEDGYSGNLETEEEMPIGREIRNVADFECDCLEDGLARLWLALKERAAT